MKEAADFPNIEHGDGDEPFRRMVAEAIRNALPDDIKAAAENDFGHLSEEQRRRWQGILDGLGGWSCPNWPMQFGGPGWSLRQQFIFERELALAGAPRLLVLGQGMLGPALIEFGTPAQQSKFLPGIRNGGILLCQGYSEPDAGSDLAALSCAARREGERYVLNGTKIWTTNAHMADWMFGLFRTGTGGRKQEGITLLLVQMKSPGVVVRPIITLDGQHEVNQVFFDHVVVPVENRIGEENDGWRLGKIMLTYERFGSAEVSRCIRSLLRLKSFVLSDAAGHGLSRRQSLVREIARLEIELRALELTEERVLFGDTVDPKQAGMGSAMLKIRGSEIQQRILELAITSAGHLAHRDYGLAPLAGDSADLQLPVFLQTAPMAFFNSRKLSIYSGANEVLKNTIARLLLA